MSERYILSDDGITPVKEPDLMKWAHWLEKPGSTIVKQETLPDGKFVSTIFLGLNLDYCGGEPILWETVVFDKEHGSQLQQNRCGGDRFEAERMHAAMLARHTNE